MQTSPLLRSAGVGPNLGVLILLLERVLVTAVIQAPLLYIIPALALGDRFSAALKEGIRMSIQMFGSTVLLISCLGTGYATLSLFGALFSSGLSRHGALGLAAVHIVYLAIGNLYVYTFIAIRYVQHLTFLNARNEIS